MTLPEEFVKTIRMLMGEGRFSRYLAAFDEVPPVSIRLNPQKSLGLRVLSDEGTPLDRAESLDTTDKVPWCCNGFYLNYRPNFTFDPLLHAGCYYVQEAASMFLDTVLRQQINTKESVNRQCLDLCAAPGGKSTLMRSVLPEGSTLFSNEPIPKRASILLENMTKWGHPNSIVTNNYPRDYVRSGLKFDIILCDVPCSGEGMFRKDPQTIAEWSPQGVEKCWRLQRDIVSDAWQCLNDGGLLIYSTCTFNTKENEENVRWILENYDAEAVSVDVPEEWHIMGSLFPNFNAPVYRFIPGITRSEGLFMAVVRKGRKGQMASEPCTHDIGGKQKGEKRKNVQCCEGLRILPPPSILRPSPTIELSYSQAISYLQRQALHLPLGTPLGFVQVCYQGFPLGLVKNLGTRANNLYPKEWAIKSTHVPSTPVMFFS